MAIPHSNSGQLIDLGIPGDAPMEPKISATALVKTSNLDVVRLLIPAGKNMANHAAPGDITVQCLKGAIDFTAGNRHFQLTPGRMLHVTAGTMHALHGVEDSAVLVTIVRGDSGAQNAG
jgi:quercetin dioxygenase-like cupin family protein